MNQEESLPTIYVQGIEQPLWGQVEYSPVTGQKTNNHTTPTHSQPNS